MAPNQAERLASGSQPSSQPLQTSAEPREFPWDFSERRGPLPSDKKPSQSTSGRQTPETKQPLQWPLPKVQELTKRRFQIQEERATGKRSEETQQQPQQNEFWLSPDENVPAPAGSSVEAPQNVVAVGPPAVAPVEVSAPQVFIPIAPTPNPTPKLSLAARLRVLAAGVRERSAKASVALGRLSERARSNFVSARSALRNSTSGFQTRLSVAAETWNNLSKRLPSYRVRLKVKSVQQLRAVAKPLQSFGTNSLKTVQQDSRLATSMAMAGLSALLTLGLILMVRKYQPTPVVASPETVKSDSGNVAPAPAVVTGNHKAPSRGTTRVQREPLVRASAIEHEKAATQRPSRRSHHNPDEDYVARDTTTYYGRH